MVISFSEVDLSIELALAMEVANAADAITLPYFQQGNFTLERKDDNSEVTQADHDAETAICAALTKHRSGHAIYGEEHGRTGNEKSDWTWVIDPIDGTSNFVRGVPIWATLIALVNATYGPVLGVVSAPALARRWWAANGLGAFADGRPIKVSQVASLSEAQVSISFNAGWDHIGATQHLVALQRDSYRARGYGDFWQHMLVAEGAIDVAVDAIGLAPYDNAAVQVVVEMAGGLHTDRFGARDYTANSAISSNGALHEEVITRLLQ